ncbi:Uncharacterized protein FWK35_00023287, partial [Aphis craccivora]
MICVFFFVSVYSTTSRNNASISNFGGGFRWQKVKSKHFLTVKKKNREKQKKKINGKTRIFLLNIFTKSVENAKICKYLKILPLRNLNFGIFRPLKHKPPFSPTIRNYILG